MKCYIHHDRQAAYSKFDGRLWQPLCEECGSKYPVSKDGPCSGDPLQADYSIGPRGAIYYCGQFAYQGKDNK